MPTTFLLGMITGLFIGFAIGCLVMALLTMARSEEREEGQHGG